MRYFLPENKKFMHMQVLPMRWGDMDAMGHINNTVYFRYFETVRIDWLRALGVQPEPGGEGFVIANAVCNFWRQLSYPGDVIARLYVSDVARTTFETWITLELASDKGTEREGLIYAEGGSTTIWIDQQLGKACSLPQWLRGKLT